MTKKRVIRRPKDAVQKELSSYNELYQDSTFVDQRKVQYKTLVTNYYSLTTDGYEYAWAVRMELKPGDKVLDIGCRVGRPLRCITYLTGAHVTGITISQYQVQ
ncbi:unnamed protein product [Rotaria sp. Silwood2]|nr:unnamed protein product [Rotaria sp. Silwood2]CAF4625950.1 unnamed protein product [Rotaria sp. Silwood2]